ncbi:AMP-binding enzyme [Cupriavidus basilensis]
MWIISGGFNIYPSDIEAVVRTHEAVADVSVVGVPSESWGETPVGFVALRDGHGSTAQAVLDWANERLGKTQRLSALQRRRQPAAQRHRQGAQARIARPHYRLSEKHIQNPCAAAGAPL